MGILEAVLEHASVRSAALVAVAIVVLRLILIRVDEHRRIKRLGNYGPTIYNYAPLGIDFIVQGVRAHNGNRLAQLWRDEYFGTKNSWTVETRVMNQRFIFTADPENMKAILATQFGDYGKGDAFHLEWKEFLGDGIFTTDGAQWHSSRQLIRPQFTRDRVSDLECFESHVETLFQAMANGGPLDGSRQGFVDLSQSHGRVVDISNLFYRYTLDVTTDFLLGADVKSLSTPKQEFAQAFDELQRLQLVMNRMTTLRFLYPKSRYRACLRVVNDFINKFIERALRLNPEQLEAKDKSYTFLHELARFSRDPQVLRDQIVSVLLAGRDTTAGTLSWAIYELARQPVAVARLRTEILEVVGSSERPTYEQLKSMPYLRAVLNETLRLYPAVPFNLRHSLVDTTLPRGGGPDGSEPLAVLKGTPIAYSLMIMQRRPDLFPPVSDSFADPAVFSPERWANWHPRPHEFIPFNAGPRICVGQQFALTEMSYVLCRLFQRFARVESHMQPIDGGEPALRIDITVMPAKGVYVAFYEDK